MSTWAWASAGWAAGIWTMLALRLCFRHGDPRPPHQGIEYDQRASTCSTAPRGSTCTMEEAS